MAKQYKRGVKSKHHRASLNKFENLLRVAPKQKEIRSYVAFDEDIKGVIVATQEHIHFIKNIEDDKQVTRLNTFN